MELRILGPFEVVDDDGRVVDVGGPRPQALLVALALAGGHPVPADQLLDQLWAGAELPGRNRLQVTVSRLRTVLGGECIVTRAGGYALEVPAGALDADRFEDLAARGRAALRRQDASAAARLLRQALGLWRGAPLAEFTDNEFAAAVITRLQEARLAAVEGRVEADLMLGGHGELAGELEVLVRAHPLRERLWGQLMVALYRSGRQGDALGAYQRARAVLSGELGVDPGPELRRLEAAVLAQDPALDAPAAHPAAAGDPALDAPAASGQGAVGPREADRGRRSGETGGGQAGQGNGMAEPLPRQAQAGSRWFAPSSDTEDRGGVSACRSVMVESPVTAPGSDVLLATKLHMPGPRPGLVPRPRLMARLDEGLARGLVLVCGPAGYGKTVLLAEWARRGEFPAAWLSLDVGDNDPARFWRHAVAALDRARPGIGDRLAPLLGPPAPSSFQGLVTALINDLAADQALLVLDDYHLIGAQQVHESLSFLVEHRPAGICVVLASRSDPPLGLARLRARGQLTEIRVAELRFTPAEAGELLQHAASALPDASVAALAARTEGWAAGLALAALSLRGHDDAAGFVAAFTGSHRYVLDYLAEEVLERQDEQLRTFLLETSVLERLSGPLCDAVTGREGSPALLEQAERAGLFLIPLDEVRGWWRYHHLFADLLRARLQQEQPGRVPKLHRNAAAWYAGHELADDAIGHAVAAGEMLWAARIIEQHFDLVYNMRGEAATIHRWLSVLPADLVRSRPRLLLAQALMAAISGRLEVVEPLLDAVERAPPGWADEPFEPAGGAAASHLINVPALTTVGRGYLAQLHGDAEATAAFAAQALAEIKPEERMLSATAHGFLAIAEWLRGRLTEAERAFASSFTGWRETGQLATTGWGWYELVLIRRAQGRLDAAVLTCEQALDTLVTSVRPLPAAGLGYAALAEIAYQRDELDLALRHATEGIALCRQFVYTTPLADALATLAMIRQATGDPAGALKAITEAVQASPGPAGLLNPVPARRARLLLAHGDLPGAARFAQENGLGPDDEPDYARESGHLVLARILLAQDRPGQALALLDRLHAAAAAQDRAGSLIETGALRALALAATGDAAGAVTALTGALALACPQGYVRVFADEGPPMAALLGRLIAAQRADRAAAGVPLGYLARLQRAFAAGPPAPDPGPSGIIEPLTSRELEVLRMLAAGRSNQAIAGELVVTLDTVKKHVGHILGKLGAANRTEAVARARELSLIP